MPCFSIWRQPSSPHGAQGAVKCVTPSDEKESHAHACLGPTITHDPVPLPRGGIVMCPLPALCVRLSRCINGTKNWSIELNLFCHIKSSLQLRLAIVCGCGVDNYLRSLRWLLLGTSSAPRTSHNEGHTCVPNLCCSQGMLCRSRHRIQLVYGTTALDPRHTAYNYPGGRRTFA